MRITSPQCRTSCVPGTAGGRFSGNNTQMTKAPGIVFSGQYRLNGNLLFEAAVEFPAAQWTCLLGRSGVGKSTILRLLLGFDTGGTFDGTIQATNALPLAYQISYMAQSALVLPWLSVLENIYIGACPISIWREVCWAGWACPATPIKNRALCRGGCASA